MVRFSAAGIVQRADQDIHKPVDSTLSAVVFFCTHDKGMRVGDRAALGIIAFRNRRAVMRLDRLGVVVYLLQTAVEFDPSVGGVH